jgi:hypothetical protein
MPSRLEKTKTMCAFGATVDIVHNETGILPELFPAMRLRAEEIMKEESHNFCD